MCTTFRCVLASLLWIRASERETREAAEAEKNKHIDAALALNARTTASRKFSLRSNTRSERAPRLLAASQATIVSHSTT